MRTRNEFGGVGRALGMFVVFALLAGAVGGIGYLMTKVNRGRYRLHGQEGMLRVERGRNLPFGYELFVPDAESLRPLYTPLPMPSDAVMGALPPLEDRADIDRALFSVLAGWARTGMEADEPEAVERAALYLDRCAALPSTSPEQKRELAGLQADFSFYRAMARVRSVREALHDSVGMFEEAVQGGTSHEAEASTWLAHARALLTQFDRLDMGRGAAPAEHNPHDDKEVPLDYDDPDSGIEDILTEEDVPYDPEDGESAESADSDAAEEAAEEDADERFEGGPADDAATDTDDMRF